MRVLVTGGAGYVGSHVILELLRSEHCVNLLEDFSNSDPNSVRRLAELAGADGAARLTVSRLDVCDTPGCTQLMRNWQPDMVIHLAGLKDVSVSMRQPLRYFDVNVGGTISLLAAMAAIDCNRLVFSSSAAVYGEPRYLPIDETHPRIPLSPYGQSKLSAENLLRDWSAQEPMRSALVLRYFNPVGCQGNTKTGQMLSCGGDALMNRVVAVADKRAPHLEVFGTDYDTPDGSGLRDFIHVADLAHAHVAALNFIKDTNQVGAGFVPINLGTGQGITVLQMAKTFQRHTGQEVPVVMAPRRSGDLAASWAEVTRAYEMLGWRAKRGYDEMCVSAWHGRNHGPTTAGPSTLQNLSGTEYSTAR